VAVCSTVVNNDIDTGLFLKSLYWATGPQWSMAHQVLEEYGAL